MSKKVVVLVGGILLVICAAGWLFFAENDEPKVLPVSDVISIQEEIVETPAEESSFAPDMEFDESSEETRIILIEPDDGKLSDLLSEKVIRDGKIVDKSQATQ
ncbi:hypothetical protein [Endozoicomonas elysicola]|uniref:Uncharacterized protein n=1 Tax=Endozoicomonas elysicola TaxID=305900 RepID=A0A081KA82_9GAMM|nr:hypothetical protein [Endozoicomonas elysicola]KEI71058.1 hypothetical protein GV64_10135 [Endozoicomonas elysicola]